MIRLRSVIAIAVLTTLSLTQGITGTVAQEAQGIPAESAHIEGTAYVCQDDARAGEAEFIVAGVSASSVDGDCRIALSGEISFTLSADGNQMFYGSTNEGGWVQFDIPTPTSFELSEDESGTSTGTIAVVTHDYVRFVFVKYVESVELPPGGGDTSSIEIQHLVCLDNDRAGETDFFAGGLVTANAIETDCSLGVGTVFTVTQQNAPLGSVQGAGALDWSTDTGGSTDLHPVPAGDYIVTEVSNGAISQAFNAPGGGTVFVTVVDYYGVAEGEASVTIHKAECNTAVADIFEACHGNEVGGVDFLINEIEATTGSDGAATVTVDEGEVTIAESEEDFDDEFGAYVFCSEQGSGDVLLDGLSETGVVTFDAAEGDQVICDWYNITDEAISPDDDDDDDKDDDVNTLPGTGTGTGSPLSSELALLLSFGTLFSVAGGFGVRRRRG